MYDKKIDPKCHICFIKGNNLFKIQSKSISPINSRNKGIQKSIFRYLGIYL